MPFWKNVRRGGLMVDNLQKSKALSPVLIATHKTADDHLVGELVLNSPQTLNALSLDMIQLIDLQLAQWATEDAVVCVVIRGAGDRAFCAGGDIQALYKAMTANHHAGTVVDDYPARFFEAEYRLDYVIHKYVKPIIALGDGFIMGGGLGVFSACRYRLVTDKTRLAMPEITIGLFPDAGASLLLGQLPVAVALFLGLTGSQVKAVDCLHVNLANYYLTTGMDNVITTLTAQQWQASSDEVVVDVLEQLSRNLPASPAMLFLEDSLTTGKDLLENMAGIRKLSTQDATFDRAVNTMTAGCPVSLGLVNEQVVRSPGLGIADVLRMELCVATHCAQFTDFQEGIRALIIDKDGKPDWSYKFDTPEFASRVTAHFELPAQFDARSHPLADLED